MDNKTDNSKLFIRLPLFFAITLAAGILIGATMGDSGGAGSISKNVEKFTEILSNVRQNYVDEVNTDELVETAINEMLKKLDPHSVYISKKDLEITKSQLEGEFEGIGIEFNLIRDTIYVISPLSRGPSEKAGILPGDKIIKVDGETVAGKKIQYTDVFSKLRGPKGTEVVLSVKRNGKDNLYDFTIIRDKIPQHSVDVSYMIDDEVGYIKVNRFAATTYSEFIHAMESLKKQGMNKLILDLQGNPGGFLDQATRMADEFIAGNKLIVYTEGKEKRYNSQSKAKKKGLFENGPLIVLIDEGSASASEIVSGALQDDDRALIVGRRSFGKGLVQLPIALNDGSELRLTISRYFTPSGRSIQKPYKEGSDYESELVERYDHGEFFVQDSIHFNDSLKFETKKGRTVYGGGGIMPDVFVPMDTSKFNSYVKELYSSNALREYTIRYYEKNKNTLSKMELMNYINNFEVSDTMLDQLVNLAEKSGVKYDEKLYAKAKPLIKNHVKANIARSIWGNEGYYPIINENNEVYQKALNLFDEAEKLAMN